jgi:AAHS family 3-hydroxyphenylpropionic acid transporter
MLAIGTFGAFTLMTAASTDTVHLVVTRLVAGVGFGAALPILILLARSSSSKSSRFSANGLIFMGVPLGGVLAATIESVFGGLVSWRFVVGLGAILPLILLPFISWAMSDRVDDERLPQAAREPVWAGLLGGRYLASTLAIWCAFGACYFTVYIASSWIPTLAARKGLEPQAAAQTSLYYNLAGILGIIVVGRLCDRFGFGKPLGISLLLSGTTLLLFAWSNDHFTLIASSAAAGFFLCGVPIALYAVAASQYPRNVRATGVGTALSVGRLGSISGPIIAGLLLQGGLSGNWVMTLAAAATLIGAIIIATLERWSAMHKQVSHH